LEDNIPLCINYALKHVKGKNQFEANFITNIPRTKLLNRGVETGTFSEITVKRLN
jgi:hypothetical protein